MADGTLAVHLSSLLRYWLYGDDPDDSPQQTTTDGSARPFERTLPARSQCTDNGFTSSNYFQRIVKPS
jgi:hypothetical protein